MVSLAVVLRESKLNWFKFCERVGDSKAVNANLEEVYQWRHSMLIRSCTATAGAGIVMC